MRNFYCFIIALSGNIWKLSDEEFVGLFGVNHYGAEKSELRRSETQAFYYFKKFLKDALSKGVVVPIETTDKDGKKVPGNVAVITGQEVLE